MSKREGPTVPAPPPLSHSAMSSGEVSAYELSLGYLKPSQVLAARYKIEAQIGQGGMGKVYRAEDLNLKRPVVIKVAHSESKEDDKDKARFRREALKMASLSHPNIVSIYDYGEQDQVQYLVMELVDGPMLKEELKERGALGKERFFEVIKQLLSGLDSAHKQQVIHRDIKPSNLMWDEAAQLLKILDFGLARGVEGDTLTGTGHVHGSIQYMAPEQIRGDSQDERTDIYAVGVLAYQLISSELPFGGESAVELMFHKLQYQPKPLMELLPADTWVSEALSSLISDCLSLEPDQRPRNAADCLSRLKCLEPALTSAPQLAREAPTQLLRDDFGLEFDDEALEPSPDSWRSLLKSRKYLSSICLALACGAGVALALSPQRDGAPKAAKRIELQSVTPKVSPSLVKPAASSSDVVHSQRPQPQQRPSSASSLKAYAPVVLPQESIKLRSESQSNYKVKRANTEKTKPEKTKRKSQRAANSAKTRRGRGREGSRPVSSPPPKKKTETIDVPLLDFP